MHLDMLTTSITAISVSGILGLVLLFAWSRDTATPLVGWWGLSQLVIGIGIVVALVAARNGNDALHALGQACMILSFSLMWMALRRFEGRTLSVFWVLLWPLAFLITAEAGLLQSFDTRLIVACSAMALLSFAAASELSRESPEPLSSRWPASFLLMAIGVGYLAWLPLTLQMPIREAGQIFASSWFPTTILVATLGRMALAFVVLAMVKERQELKQRIDALTDPLTGLPNRRALFEAADRLAGYAQYFKGDPISVLVFDLDHFKKINDTYGHRLGDRVLQLFATTMSEKLATGSILGRLGGEEFAAILPGADLRSAARTAERIRIAFQERATVIDDTPVACTVSIGAASHDDVDCDLSALFHRADSALYAAKNAGRNRVETIDPQEPPLGVAARPPVAGRAELEPNFRRYRHLREQREQRAQRSRRRHAVS